MRLICLLFLLLSACNPLKMEPLEPPKPPENYTTEQTEPVVQLSERWWEDFNDPQLNQLQQQLFSNNLDLRQALYRLRQLEALQRINGASLWPQINLNGSINRDSTPGRNDNILSTNKRFSVAAGYELDLWNKLKDREKAAELRRQAGEEEVQSLLLSLSAQLSEQYFLAVEQRAQLKLLDRQIKQRKIFLETVTDRYRAGLSTGTEVYRGQQNLAIAETLIPEHHTILTRAENSIALLLGQPPGSVQIERDELPQLNNLVDIGLPADLLVRRPDVAAALLQLSAADHELAAALAARLPSINLSATLGRSFRHLSTGDIDGTFWNLALGLSQPLVDGGRLKAESERQEAIRAENLEVYRQTMLRALRDVETALATAANDTNKATKLERQRHINQKSLLLTRDNYLYGLTDSRDLVNSQILQLEILRQQLSNQRQQLSDRITLARALGGSWMGEELTQQQQTMQTEQDKTNE